jgi:hypothetical protein
MRTAFLLLLAQGVPREVLAQIEGFSSANGSRATDGRTADSIGAGASYEGCALGAIITSNLNRAGVHMVTHSRAYVFFFASMATKKEESCPSSNHKRFINVTLVSHATATLTH